MKNKSDVKVIQTGLLDIGFFRKKSKDNLRKWYFLTSFTQKIFR